MRIGVWQDETPKGGIDAALARIQGALSVAKEGGVDMLVFPECFLTGYYMQAEDVPSVAATVTDAVLAQLQSLCNAAQVAFVLGSYKAVAGGVANTAFVFRPGASAALSYDKRALYGAWEKAVFQAGHAPLLFDYEGVKFAVLICFDVEFPELVREAAGMGAEAVLVPTALMSPEDAVADFMVPARAFENNITIAYANRIGTEEHLSFVGKSQLCDGDAARRVVAQSSHRGLISIVHQANAGQTDYLGELGAMKTD